MSIADNIVYDKLTYDSSYIYALLVHSGYLKLIEKGVDGNCKLAIPNKEVFRIYSTEILSTMNVPCDTAAKINDALLQGDAVKLKEALQTFMGSTISFMQYKKEYFHQVMLTGILSVMDGNYDVLEDMEAGEGRADILLKPKKKMALPGIVIEVERATEVRTLSRRARAAINQINEKQYDMPLKAAGCARIYKVGIAFKGKLCEVVIE